MIRDLRSVENESLLRASFRSWTSLAVGFLFALLVFVPRSQAQVSAAISGRVTDPTGAVVSGATVTAANLETQAARTSVTDEAGRYSILSLPIGIYEIRVSKPGFQEALRSGIHLVVGQQAVVDVSLSIGQVSEQVKVVADAPMVSVTYADISGLVGEQQIKDLPLNGRSYDELMTLHPGVVNFTWEKTGGIGISNSTTGNMFSVAGNRPQQNLFLLNGVEFTGAAENNMQPGGTSQQLLGVDAVREFNLLRDSYGAEYGKNKLTYMEDTYLSQSHVGTHIDGMGHIGVQDCYYNQTPMGKFITQNGIKKLGLENLKSFATRGVLLDMVKVFQDAGKLKTNPNCRTPCLDGGTVITEADIQAGLKMYNVTLREGDAVFIHTGWGDLFNQFPAQNANYNKAEPGIGKAAAAWLANQKVVLVGTDTWAVEVIPSEDTQEAFPVHALLLTDNGIHIIENVRTDLIAAEAASSKRATFFLSMTVPKAAGTTGTFVNIEAIR